MQHSFNLSQRNLSHIGYQLLKQRPEIAEEIISLAPLPDNTEVDLSFIPTYFDRFCQVMCITESDLYLKNNYAMAERRRLFIAAILRVYHPTVFSNPLYYFKPRIGLQKQLCAVLRIDDGNISREVYRVRTRVRAYSDFAEQAISIYNKITSDGNNGQG